MSLILIAVALAGLYAWYASIVTRNNRVAEALSGVDVQLQQRHDLIPKLLKIAARFMSHERELLASVASLRSEAASGMNLGQRLATEAKLGDALGRLFAVAEAYPQLKADGPMLEAQRSLEEVETNIAAARRFYNAAVTALRNACGIFPGGLLATLAGVTSQPPFFEAPTSAREPVDAALSL